MSAEFLRRVLVACASMLVVAGLVAAPASADLQKPSQQWLRDS
jgi:alpha-L-fucosidase